MSTPPSRAILADVRLSHISRSSLIIAFFFGIDKVFAFARQIIQARIFGLTYDIDVFNAANNIPDLLSALISGGALGVAMIPVLSEYLQSKGRGEAWELFSRILNLAFLVTGIFALVIAVFAEPLVGRVIAPGFPDEQKALAAELMRLDLFAILIFSISGLMMAGLQANQHFIMPAMAPIFYNVGQLFGLMFLAPEPGATLGPLTLPGQGLGIHGLVYGVILGAALHLGIQIPALIKYRFKWVFGLGLNTPGVRQVMRLLGPRVATMFFIQSYFIIRDNLASRLGEGSVTALNYGWFIMQVPETLIGTALAIAILPTLSEHFARGDAEAYRDTINRAVRALLALTVPITALLFVGIGPLVQVLGFDAAGTAMVISATRIYLLGLAGHSLLELASRSFYARQNAWVPFGAAAFTAALYLGLALLFTNLWGFVGIALANTAAFTLEALILFWLLHRRAPGILKVDSTVWRVVAGAVFGGLVVWGGLTFLPLNAWSL
ncbi:MAG: murein biosynthesis integral membrane protein MurJ, partial [Anaerolineales bacterium]|nr:murein biosynthesis integral membrane protein MurJ [Anaerolineales bacterium]